MSEKVVDLFRELYDAENIHIASILSTSKTVELKDIKVWDIRTQIARCILLCTSYSKYF